MAVPVAGEVIAQHHGLVAHGGGKAGVEVECGAEAAQLLGKARLLAERPLCQLAQHGQAGAGVGFGKQHVKPQHRHLLALQQLVRQLRQQVAPPGPVAYGLQAALVDVDDDDARVLRARHGGAQVEVVGAVVQPLQGRHVQPAGGMQQGQQQGEQGQPHIPPPPAKPAHAPAFSGGLQGHGRVGGAGVRCA